MRSLFLIAIHFEIRLLNIHDKLMFARICTGELGASYFIQINISSSSYLFVISTLLLFIYFPF
jgi:hypothetical protein